jgi:UDP-N-acetylmuramate: L-alanyl-gamma-D-glutamyl-meso-diaminopimelate ligase
VAETLTAVRNSFKPQRLWAIYEPRSATSRRKVFQQEIAEALSLADCVAISGLFKAEKIAAEDRLDLQQVVDDLRGQGRLAWHVENVASIIETVCREARSGDYVVIMSNGGFGGIYERLPDALAKRNQLGC